MPPALLLFPDKSEDGSESAYLPPAAKKILPSSDVKNQRGSLSPTPILAAASLDAHASPSHMHGSPSHANPFPFNAHPSTEHNATATKGAAMEEGEKPLKVASILPDVTQRSVVDAQPLEAVSLDDLKKALHPRLEEGGKGKQAFGGSGDLYLTGRRIEVGLGSDQWRSEVMEDDPLGSEGASLSESLQGEGEE